MKEKCQEYVPVNLDTGISSSPVPDHSLGLKNLGYFLL